MKVLVMSMAATYIWEATDWLTGTQCN